MRFHIEKLVKEIIKEDDKYNFINANKHRFVFFRKSIFQEFFGFVKDRIIRDVTDNLDLYIDEAYDVFIKHKKICEVCDGQGRKTANIPLSMAYHRTEFKTDCSNCKGDGYIDL